MGLSRRAYGKRIGVSEGAVRYAIKAGRIEVEPDGTIDPEKADRQWAQNTRAGGHAALPTAAKASQQGEAKGTNGSSTAAEEAALEDRSRQQTARLEEVSARAAITRLRLGEAEGRLVEREVVEAYVFDRMRQIRDAWMAWPAKVAPMLAVDLGLEDVRTVERALDKYVREHLEDLAQQDSDDVDDS